MLAASAFGYFFFFFPVLGMEPRGLHMLGKLSTTELYTLASVSAFFLFRDWV
jgi:hypothetical protein